MFMSLIPVITEYRSLTQEVTSLPNGGVLVQEQESLVILLA